MAGGSGPRRRDTTPHERCSTYRHPCAPHRLTATATGRPGGQPVCKRHNRKQKACRTHRPPRPDTARTALAPCGATSKRACTLRMPSSRAVDYGYGDGLAVDPPVLIPPMGLHKAALLQPCGPPPNSTPLEVCAAVTLGAPNRHTLTDIWAWAATAMPDEPRGKCRRLRATRQCTTIFVDRPARSASRVRLASISLAGKPEAQAASRAPPGRRTPRGLEASVKH